MSDVTLTRSRMILLFDGARGRLDHPGDGAGGGEMWTPWLALIRVTFTPASLAIHAAIPGLSARTGVAMMA